MDLLKRLTDTLHINKWYLIAIFIVVLIQLPAALVSANRNLLNFSNLQHNIYWSDTIDSDSKSAIAIVSNSGFGFAEKVFIQIKSRGVSFDAYAIDSLELYDVKTLDKRDGILSIWLDRLGSGSYITIEISGSNLTESSIFLTVISNQGSSTLARFPDHVSQIQHAQNSSVNPLNPFEKAVNIIQKSPKTQNILKTVVRFRIFSAMNDIVKSDDFRTIISTNLAFSLLVGIFFGARRFVVSLIIGVWLALWITYDASVSANWIFIPILMLILLYIIGFIMNEIDFVDNIKIILILSIIVLVICAFLFMKFSSIPVSIHWITFMYLSFLLYIVVVS
jgi:hypothetical protein